MHKIRPGFRQQNIQLGVHLRNAMLLREGRRPGPIRIQHRHQVDLLRVRPKPAQMLAGNIPGTEEGGA